MTAEPPSGPARMPGQTSPGDHPHPRRHRRALTSALTVAGIGVFIFIAGAYFLVSNTRSGLLVSLMVVGITFLLLAPVWYFTYMERLEPDLYSVDSPQTESKTKSERDRR